MPVITALRRQNEEDGEFQAILSYSETQLKKTTDQTKDYMTITTCPISENTQISSNFN
jgi:hypothetical protein